MSDKSYKAQCFCGAVQFTVTGEPAAAGYCHCGSCRLWAAAPVNGFTLWAPSAIKVTQGADQIGVFNKSEQSYRKFCKTCGGHLFTEHPPWNLVDVYSAVIPDFPFDPQVHVHYVSTVMPMKDGKPKFHDVPKEMGGSGQLLAE